MWVLVVLVMVALGKFVECLGALSHHLKLCVRAYPSVHCHHYMCRHGDDVVVSAHHLWYLLKVFER